MRIDWMEKYLHEAEQLIFDNRVNEGIALLQNLLYDEPGYGYLHNHLGWAYMYYTPDVAQAALHLKMAITFDKEYSAPYLHMGNLMIRCNRYAEAIDYLQQGLQKPSANRVVFLEAMGQAWELRGDFGLAINAYREAMMASLTDQEVTNMTSHVARCRKKRWASFWKV
jgi:tetratricopeptide (TPR) repeat protein